jgi:hypothetical protein
LWREAHDIYGDDPLGRPLPTSHRDGAARAAMAAADAVELATGKTPGAPQ